MTVIRREKTGERRKRKDKKERQHSCCQVRLEAGKCQNADAIQARRVVGKKGSPISSMTRLCASPCNLPSTFNGASLPGKLRHSRANTLHQFVAEPTL